MSSVIHFYVIRIEILVHRILVHPNQSIRHQVKVSHMIVLFSDCWSNWLFLFLFLGCTENVNQSFGTLDVRYTSKFDPHCNWVIGHSGIDQAVAIVSIRQISFTNLRYVAFVAAFLRNIILNITLQKIPAKGISGSLSTFKTTSYVVQANVTETWNGR